MQGRLLYFTLSAASLCTSCAMADHRATVPEDFSAMRGANYVPSYARNDVQIWMGYDSAVIDRELGYAERLRLNTVRVFLQFAVYERDPKGSCRVLRTSLPCATGTASA